MYYVSVSIGSNTTCKGNNYYPLTGENMALNLSKNNAPVYDYYSTGDNSDPVTVTGTLNGAGGTLDSSVVTAYLVATTYRYTAISLTVSNEQAGIDWKLSLNNSTWLDTVTPTDMDALSVDVVTPVYIKAVLTNDGSGNQPVTGIYTTPDIRIQATENPA